jgi:hypothetical protein
MPRRNGAAKPPSGPDDLPLFRQELGARLDAAGAPGVALDVSWMTAPLAGFRVTLREGRRAETFGVPLRVLAGDQTGRTLDRIVDDALRRLRR